VFLYELPFASRKVETNLNR